VVAATIGWEGGPVTEGLLGMALLGLASWIGPKVASTADVTALQQEITSVQQEISTESVEVAAIQTTVTGFQQLVGAGAGTQQALAEVTGSWTSESDAIDAVLAELSNAQSDVSHEQVAAAQAAMAGLAERWTALVAAMQLLSGVSVQVAGQPVPIPQS
jgi:cell division protein FtsB